MTNALYDQCDLHSPETVQHVLFECNGNRDMYERLWKPITLHCPNSLLIDINNMNNRSKTSFFLSCLNSSFVIEWMQLYEAIINFICSMYNDRVHIL